LDKKNGHPNLRGGRSKMILAGFGLARINRHHHRHDDHRGLHHLW